jgi:hypothetical protein
MVDTLQTCPHEECVGGHTKPHPQHCERALRDPKNGQFNVKRRKCIRFGSIHWVYPQGTSRSEYWDWLRAAGVMLSLCGISQRSVEDFLTALGYPVDHVTVDRDVQEAEEKARAGLEVAEASRNVDDREWRTDSRSMRL